MLRIKHGFVGQRRVVLPFHLSDQALLNPLTSDIVIHSMGYFPHAEGHYIDRPNGCGEQLLIYCVKGRGSYVLEGKKYDVGPQQYFVLPANVQHRYWSDNKDPWTIYYTHFQGPASGEIAKRICSLNSLELSDTSRIDDRIEMFNHLLNILENSYDEDAITYANMSFMALLASFLEVRWFQKAKFPVCSKNNAAFVSKVIHIMEENISGKITINELASYFGCSESHFYRLFHEETGYAPYEYYMKIKMERARVLLENTMLKVGQVSTQVGFDDRYFFSKSFRKVYGQSPREWRKAHANNN